MAKQKKVNTLDLIQQMTLKNKKAVDVLEDIKNDRSVTPSPIKQHLHAKNVRQLAGEVLKKDNRLYQSDTLTKKKSDVLEELHVLLNSKTFNDKKDTFVLSLSGHCLGKYEELAPGISYKLGIKTSRNDLIRKVLEYFINSKYEELKRTIDKNKI